MQLHNTNALQATQRSPQEPSLKSGEIYVSTSSSLPFVLHRHIVLMLHRSSDATLAVQQQTLKRESSLKHILVAFPQLRSHSPLSPHTASSKKHQQINNFFQLPGGSPTPSSATLHGRLSPCAQVGALLSAVPAPPSSCKAMDTSALGTSSLIRQSWYLSCEMFCTQQI